MRNYILSTYPFMARVGGLVFVILGGYMLYTGQYPPVAVIVMLVGSIMITIRDGILIDQAKNQIKEYTQLLGIKIGEWKSLDNYPDMVVLKSNTKQTRQMAVGGPAVSIGLSNTVDTCYEICLANPNHFKLLVLEDHRTYEKALEQARIICTDLGKELVSYNPGRRMPRKVL